MIDLLILWCIVGQGERIHLHPPKTYTLGVVVCVHLDLHLHKSDLVYPCLIII